MSNSLDVKTTNVIMKEKLNRLRFHFGPATNRHLKTKQIIYKFIKVGNIIGALEIRNGGGSGCGPESGL